jgi:hypothetical protein
MRDRASERARGQRERVYYGRCQLLRQPWGTPRGERQRRGRVQGGILSVSSVTTAGRSDFGPFGVTTRLTSGVTRQGVALEDLQPLQPFLDCQ